MDDRLPPVGRVLRRLRARAGVSQLELSTRTGVSTRHLSYIETGRAEPSRELLLRIADGLHTTPADRDDLLRAGGIAVHASPDDPGDPLVAELQEVVDRLGGVPAIVLDAQWTLVVANRAAQMFLAAAAEPLRVPPVNLLRLLLHPDGLLASLVNAREVRDDLLARLDRQRAQTGDPILDGLAAELAAYGDPSEHPARDDRPEGSSIPMRLHTPVGEIAVAATPAVLGLPNAPTRAELSLELFPPIDAESAARLTLLLADD